MKVNYNKLYCSIMDDEKLPRKLKKHILGKKLSKYKLNKLLKNVTIGEPASTMYETPKISPYPFCPKCGCREKKSTGNMTTYPEHWEHFLCIRCGFLVGVIDNSPFYHALEFKSNNYELN